ncbi:pilus assembly protein [Paraburkholderia sp. Ac-20336]|nr:pilus assembly protein [Paraburkholderia sp. Ac-20336]
MQSIRSSRTCMYIANASRQRAQRGATAVEFGLVFPLFFLILYAIVTYSVIFVAQQNLTLAASEGARAALNWQTNVSMATALTNRGNAACAAAKLVVQPLVSAMQCAATNASCGTSNAMTCITVSLTYNYKSNPLLPALPLLGLAMPTMLSGSATVQLNPENIQ